MQVLHGILRPLKVHEDQNKTAEADMSFENNLMLEVNEESEPVPIIETSTYGNVDGGSYILCVVMF